MTERYLWAHSVMHHHNELNVTKGLATGSCITVRVKRLAGNEIEQGIGIPTIESRASNIPIDKGNCIRDKEEIVTGVQTCALPIWAQRYLSVIRSDKSQS